MGRHRIDDAYIYIGEDKEKCEKDHRLRIASRKCYQKDPLKKGAHYVRKRLSEGRTVTRKTMEKYKQYVDPSVYDVSD